MSCEVGWISLPPRCNDSVPCCVSRAVFLHVAPGNDDRSAIPDTLPAQIGCLVQARETCCVRQTHTDEPKHGFFVIFCANNKEVGEVEETVSGWDEERRLSL